MLNIDDSISHCRGNFAKLYPKTESRRKVFGNIPERLHDEIADEAKRRNVCVYELVSGLWDFFKQYEDENKKELAEQRKTPTPR